MNGGGGWPDREGGIGLQTQSDLKVEPHYKTMNEGLHLVGLDLRAIAEAQHSLTCARTRRGPALDGGGEQPREQGSILGELVGIVSKTTSFDDADDASNHALEDPTQFLGLRRGAG